ncbi:MAG: hypothetical protein ABMA01_02940 [Chthoniobacteraceae bacterium]
MEFLVILFVIIFIGRFVANEVWPWLSEVIVDNLGTLLLIPVVFVATKLLVRAVENAREAESKRAAEADREMQRQRELRNSLDSLVVTSRQTAIGLPQLVQSAEDALDRAEKEYVEGAFVHFWDAVEDAAQNLAKFNAHLQALTSNSKRHRAESTRLTAPSDPFTLGIQRLPDATDTADRLRSVARVAQKNYQFASIYQQRKTNQLLIGGFSSLTQAINDLGSSIESALDQLASSVSIELSEIGRSQREAFGEFAGFRAEAATEARRQSKHDESVEEKLDNIQRRRRPRPEKFWDGEF